MGRSFTYNKKQYSIKADDGWTEVIIEGNKARITGHAYWQLERSKIPGWVQGYTHNNNIVFQNFDVAKRKWQFGPTTHMFFNKATSFEAVNAIVWEDRRVYYVELSYSDLKCFELRDLLDSNGSIAEHKGVTPELQTVLPVPCPRARADTPDEGNAASSGGAREDDAGHPVPASHHS